MKATLVALFACVLRCTQPAHAFELLYFQRYMLKSSTMYMSVEDHTPYGILAELTDVTTDAVSEWNAVPHNRMQIQLATTRLTMWAKHVSHLLVSDFHFHAGLNTRNGGPLVAFTNFTFDNRWSVPVRSSVHIYVDYFPDWTTLYNVVLHELGHVNLVGHTDLSSFRKIVTSDTNLPIMGQTGTMAASGQLQKQFKSRLELDDVCAIMYRMHVEDSLPTTDPVGKIDTSYAVNGRWREEDEDAPLEIVDFTIIPYLHV